MHILNELRIVRHIVSEAEEFGHLDPCDSHG
jgi:hypothetical protein